MSAFDPPALASSNALHHRPYVFYLAALGSAGFAVQIMSVTPFSDLLDRPLARPRFAAFLLIVFGAMALLLTTVGLYAVVAAYARQRDREIAVRLALGASAQSVRGLVLAEAGRMAGFGVLLGLGGAVASTRALQGMLFEISPLDPMSIAAAAVLIGVAAALAAYGPVRRTAHADLMSTLRSQ